MLTKPDTYAGGPILDGKIVTSMSMPGEALRKRTAAKVPVLIATTSDDVPVLFPPRDNPLSFFSPNAAAAKAVYFWDDRDLPEEEWQTLPHTQGTSRISV